MAGLAIVSTGLRIVYALLVAQSLDWVQARGLAGREIAEYHAHCGGEHERDDNDARVEDEGHSEGGRACFDTVYKSRARKIDFWVEKHLGFVSKSSERRAVNDRIGIFAKV